MKLGYVIIYVEKVADALAFYESAFGLTRKFLHESGAYGELSTGEATLAFASHELAGANLPDGYAKLTELASPAGIEIGLVADDVPAAIRGAVDAGATLIAEAKQKPWGQTVGYVRAPDGVLVELCTPMSG